MLRGLQPRLELCNCAFSIYSWHTDHWFKMNHYIINLNIVLSFKIYKKFNSVFLWNVLLIKINKIILSKKKYQVQKWHHWGTIALRHKIPNNLQIVYMMFPWVAYWTFQRAFLGHSRYSFGNLYWVLKRGCWPPSGFSKALICFINAVAASSLSSSCPSLSNTMAIK